MKGLFSLAALAALAVLGSASPLATSDITERDVASHPGSYPSSSFATHSGTEFVIDGKSGYFAGTNTYWIGFLTNNSDVDLVMRHISESGLKILRVWGFNDVTTIPGSGTVYYQAFVPGSAPTINTGADGLQRLDVVVAAAKKYGVKLIINFVNNWTDYGGMAAYFTYANITSNSEWYNNTKAQTQYKKYIKAVVSRYSTSTAIFSWELANEPRCDGCDPSIIRDWISQTAKYIKSIDSKHMVTIGDEGFGVSAGSDGSYPYQLSAGGYNFTLNCAVPQIDFCTYHLYPLSWGTSPGIEWGNAWITNHATICKSLGKPCLLEEFGYTDNCTTESAWQATALSSFSAGTAADMFWQYGDTISTGETAQDGNTVYYGNNTLFECIVTDHIKAIKATS